MASQTSNSPEYKGPTGNAAQPQRLERVYGLFQTADDVPNAPARKLDEQIRIVSGRAYIYDATNNVWLPLGGEAIYPGNVNADGSAGTPFPSGWSVTRISAGRYTITHNLGLVTYAVSVTNLSAFSNVASITDKSSNSFQVTLYNNTTGASWPATDTAFDFVLAVA